MVTEGQLLEEEDRVAFEVALEDSLVAEGLEGSDVAVTY